MVVIIRSDEQRLDDLAKSIEPEIDSFKYLTLLIMQYFVASISGPNFYGETEYFGGSGPLCVAHFENRQLTWRGAESNAEPSSESPLVGLYQEGANGKKSPINEGVSRLGVVRSDESDDFEQIGLGRFRPLEDLGSEYLD